MRRRHLVLVLTILLAGLAGAQRVPTLAAAKQQQIEQAVARFMAKNGVPGLSVAVVEGGAFEWANGYGTADLENSVPARAGTVYRLASISKPITATAAMQLVEQGKLELDAPIQKYCPAFPPHGAVITTRQLLAHMSGIRHYRGGDDDAEWLSTRHYRSIKDALALFANDPLLATPGTEFHYSTHGYTVVGCVIEGAAGESYIEYVRRHIFTPAGMAHSDADDLERIIPDRAPGYRRDKAGALLNSTPLDSSYKLPGGGLVSTAEDMARFEAALLGDHMVARRARDAMWSAPLDAHGANSGYGLGWEIADEDGLRTVGHGGAQPRVTTAILLQPEKAAGVVILCNLEDVNVRALADELLRILLGAPRSGETK